MEEQVINANDVGDAAEVVLTPQERLARAKTVLATSRDEVERAQAYADIQAANNATVALAPDLSCFDAIIGAADALGENAGIEVRAMRARIVSLFTPQD